MAVPTLTARLWFPDPHRAVATGPEAGLVAIGGDLSVGRLLLAYRMGVFPWTSRPVTWWSPDPRGIFELEAFHTPRSLEKLVRRSAFRVTMDRAFSAVMAGCAAPTPDRPETWISRSFLEAYGRLHRAGHAHSVECWREDQLVGGIYGVAIGGLFAGESMFHQASNASKIALYHLVQHLRGAGFRLFDIQMVTPVTLRLGAITIPRAEYLRRLAEAVELDCRF